MNKTILKLMGSLGFSTLLFGSAVPADTTQGTTTSAPTDRQIVKIVETVNNAEIGVSRLAEKSANAEVRSLAKNMVKAHSESNSQTEKLARSLSLKMEDSQTSDNLKEDAKTKLADLKKLQGADFDKAYVDSLVKAHQSALNEFDDTLIPSAKDSHLKTHLEDTRKVVEAHLEHAKQVQTALNK